MKTMRLASLAGLAASVIASQFELAAQQPTRPSTQPPARQNPGSPTTNPSTVPQPGQTTPNQPTQNPQNPGTPTTNPSTTPQPGQVLPAPAVTNRDLLAQQRFFQLQNLESEARLNEVGQRLMRIETQLA